MASISPLRALRPPLDKVEAIASPPYDVLSEEEAREFCGENPYCFLRVTRPEIEFGRGTDPYCDAVYARGASNLQKFRREGTLVQDETGALFVYRQQMGDHVQTGVVGLCSVDEYDQDLIKKHERTRSDKEEDRSRYIIRTRSQFGPVFMTFRDRRGVLVAMQRCVEDEPEYSFSDDRGVVHTVWRIDENDERCGKLVEAFAAVPVVYIADGHHRAKSASRAREEFARTNSNHTGAEPYNKFLAAVFPARQLQILAYNRVVLSTHGERPKDVLVRIKRRFRVAELEGPSQPARGCFTLYLGGQWYGLRPIKAPKKNNIAGLDVAVCQTELLGAVFDIDDPRTDPNVEFVGGVHGPEVLKEKADDRGGAVIILHPTRIEDVLRVADAGGVMPPKSTWFEPKLRSGLFVHAF
jgi:uncharacterized protein (DUF1015 family)